MSMKALIIALMFIFTVVINVNAIFDCDSSCEVGKTTFEEQCAFCICTRRAVEMEQFPKIGSFVFLYFIPKLEVILPAEVKFSSIRLKPPNKIQVG